METFAIAEVARRTGLTMRALHFYDARGLVRPLSTAAGRRVYGAGELSRLHAVVASKRARLGGQLNQHVVLDLCRPATEQRGGGDVHRHVPDGADDVGDRLNGDEQA